MDKSKWLSFNEIENIFNSKNQIHDDKLIYYKHDKNFLSLPDDEKQKFIDLKIDEQFNSYENANIKLIESLGIIEWLDEQMESIYLNLRNRPSFMGKSRNGQIYLNAEESLFLIESNNVICYYKSLQLSVQDAYSLMIKNQLEFERYMTYSFLLRFGYRAIRNSSNGDSQINNEDNKISNNDNQMNNDIELLEEQFNPIKRSISIDSTKQFKKTKSDDEVNLFENQIKITPLSQLIKDLHLLDENNLKLMKFLRYQKLINKRQSNWNDILNEFNLNKINFNTSLLIDNMSDNLPKQLKDDFIDEYSIIKLNELLTEDQIKQRLIDNGPKIDLDDYFTQDNNELDKLIDNNELDKSMDNNEMDKPIDSNELDESIDNNELDKSKDNNLKINDIDYDYNIYLPSRKERIQDLLPDYYLKIIHSSQLSNFPIDLIFKLNAKIKYKEKLLFAFCISNELNFYILTDIDLINC